MKSNGKLLAKGLLFVLFAFAVADLRAFPIANLSKKEFLRVMAEGNLAEIDNALEKIGTPDTQSERAYQGTLLMKKSGLLKVPAQKLSTFKKGHRILEEVIQKNPDVAEYRFFRLTIQEKAPKIVKYSSDLDADKAIVISEFDKFDAVLKAGIIEYAKSSKVLKPSDFR